VKPAPFLYRCPGTVDEALALLEEHGYDAKLLAGGQSLIPTMNFRLSEPAVLIDLNRVDDLAGIEGRDGGVWIGAMTRQRSAERSETVRQAAPLVAETLPWIAHPQIRNRGTVGGSLAHADPASELPAVALALEARLLVRGKSGERWVPASEFFTGLFATALGPEEILLGVEFPAVPAAAGWAFEEVSRRHGDYALVGVAVLVTSGSGGRCDSARVALLSVGDGPVVSTAAAGPLVGQEPTAGTIGEAAAAAARDVDPPSDIHASSDYRRQLVRVLTRRALTRAFNRTQGRE
jgi:CO/xanthine dehydrogenase FAD-binding subunit